MSRDVPAPSEAVAMRARLIEAFGAPPGLRDPDALEAALMRPRLGYYRDLVEEAAALLESLANHHPFLDGNKRVAFFVTDTFLRMNDHRIECDSETAHAFFMRLFEIRAFRFDRLEPWLRERVRAG